MKTLAILVTVLGLSAGTALAQPATPAKPALRTPSAPMPGQPDLLKDVPVVPLDKAERYIYFQTHTLNKVFGLNLHYAGIAPQIKRADRPLQLLNPFAPARYGDAFDNVSVDPVTGRAEGITVFAIRF
jgi:hypothetical protein